MTRQGQPIPEAEVPSTNKSQSRTHAFARGQLWAATGTPVLPPRAQLPARFHTLTRARPTSPWLFTMTRGPHAACWLLQLGHPRTHLRTSQILGGRVTSTTTPPGSDASGETPPAKLSQARGQPFSSPPFRQPPARMDLPQPIRLEHPLSPVDTRRRPETYT